VKSGLAVNMLRQGTHASTAAVAAVGLIALPAALATGHGATGHGAATQAGQAPRLAISVSDGKLAARAGQSLTYTIRLSNTGTATATRLKVTQTMSPGLMVTGASAGAARGPGWVAWSATVPAGGARAFRVTARVARTPARVLRLAAVACAGLAGRPPLVCAAHLDRLPAAQAGHAREAAQARHAVLSGPLAAAGLCLLAVCIAALLRGVFRRRGRREPAEQIESISEKVD